MVPEGFGDLAHNREVCCLKLLRYVRLLCPGEIQVPMARDASRV